jgi:dimethylargininase
MAHPLALTRAISPAMADCELTHLPRVPIDVDKAVAQHAAYEQALTGLGCRVTRLPAAPDSPDSVFIEDTAIVLDEIAVIARPGAASRRAETAGVEEVLKHERVIARIEAPGTLDGGDVLVVGRAVFVGATARTNVPGTEQLRRILEHFGYATQVIDVDAAGCLHLKSAVTALSDDTLLINPRWAPAKAFANYRLIEVDPAEPGGANIVRVGEQLLYSDAFPRTLARLGRPVTTVDVSEIAKAEGAVTCCSLIVNVLEETSVPRPV